MRGQAVEPAAGAPDEARRNAGAIRALPHSYALTVTARADGDVAIGSRPLPSLLSAPPAEFGGPGDRWSPETLIVAAVGDCFVLTFRAVARQSKFTWTSLVCDVAGTLDKRDRVTQFTDFAIRARLRLPAGTDQDVAHRLLYRAEQSCLIANSLKVKPRLEAEIVMEASTGESGENSTAA